MHEPNSVKKSFSGIYYFNLGWKLILTPGLKRYVFIPLLVNILLMGGAFWWIFSNMSGWIDTLMSIVPSWLQWLSYILWPLAIASILLVSGYLFSTIANLIASPFNGLLSEQLESKMTGKSLPDSGFTGIIKDVPRILKREIQKLAYYLPRIILLIILSLIPGIGQTIAPVLLFVFGAWMQSIQYCDYPFDNHKIPLLTMRKALQRDRMQNFQFGALVSLFTMVPFLNLVIMPVAVCGATAIWVDKYRDRV